MMTWQEKNLTWGRNFLTPVISTRGGDGSNKLESILVDLQADKSCAMEAVFCHSLRQYYHILYPMVHIAVSR
jgi:hypothetical protein